MSDTTTKTTTAIIPETIVMTAPGQPLISETNLPSAADLTTVPAPDVKETSNSSVTGETPRPGVISSLLESAIIITASREYSERHGHDFKSTGEDASKYISNCGITQSLMSQSQMTRAEFFSFLDRSLQQIDYEKKAFDRQPLFVLVLIARGDTAGTLHFNGVCEITPACILKWWKATEARSYTTKLMMFVFANHSHRWLSAASYCNDSTVSIQTFHIHCDSVRFTNWTLYTTKRIGASDFAPVGHKDKDMAYHECNLYAVLPYNADSRLFQQATASAIVDA